MDEKTIGEKHWAGRTEEFDALGRRWLAADNGCYFELHRLEPDGTWHEMSLEEWYAVEDKDTGGPLQTAYDMACERIDARKQGTL